MSNAKRFTVSITLNSGIDFGASGLTKAKVNDVVLAMDSGHRLKLVYENGTVTVVDRGSKIAMVSWQDESLLSSSETHPIIKSVRVG